MSTRLNRFMLNHPILTYIACGVSFGLFSFVSLDLVRLLKANLTLFLDYGTMVIGEGAVEQLAGLVLYGYLSLALFLTFKTCEHVLVGRATHHAHLAEYRD
jgi:hypothetical protein